MGPRKHIASPLGSPSKILLSFVDRLLQPSHPLILDAGCGFGRNALALAARGAPVICLDRDRDRLQKLMTLGPRQLSNVANPKFHLERLYPVCADVTRWPFPKGCFSAIVCVHLDAQELFESFRYSLAPNGYLYVETFGNRGENYLDLPKAGQFRNFLSNDFELLFYRERKAGPAGYDAVSVTVMAHKCL